MDSALWKRLPKSPSMKAFKERWKMALHFTSEEQLENFNLLNVGFCSKFATLANQGYLPFTRKNRKFQLENQMVRTIPFGKLQKI